MSYYNILFEKTCSVINSCITKEHLHNASVYLHLAEKKFFPLCCKSDIMWTQFVYYVDGIYDCYNTKYEELYGVSLKGSNKKMKKIIVEQIINGTPQILCVLNVKDEDVDEYCKHISQSFDKNENVCLFQKDKLYIATSLTFGPVRMEVKDEI